jgi:hypothetical protein
MAARRSGCWGGAQPRQQDGKHGGQPGQDQQDTSPAAIPWLLWPVVVGALGGAPLAVDHALPSVVHAGAWHAARGMVLGPARAATSILRLLTSDGRSPGPQRSRGRPYANDRAGLVWRRGAREQPKQLPRDRALEAAADLALALALGGASRHIALGRLVVALADQHDGVQGAVELAVAAAVDSLGRRGCQVGLVVWLTILGGQAGAGKVASCPASRCDLSCASSAM